MSEKGNGLTTALLVVLIVFMLCLITIFAFCFINNKNNKDYQTSNSPQSTSTPAVKSTPKILGMEQIAKMKESIVLIETDSGTGSGVIINKEGDILTNNHVTSGVSLCYIYHQGTNGELGDKIIASVVYTDADKDLALLKQNSGSNEKFIPLGDESKLVEGQKIATIGSPKGLINTISEGIISSFREIDKTSYIQITAPISNGSSGGALLNMNGELIGVTTLGIKDIGNLNFAIALKEIKMFIKNSSDYLKFKTDYKIQNNSSSIQKNGNINDKSSLKYLDDFETENGVYFPFPEYVKGSYSTDTNIRKNGSYSGKLSYDFTSNTSELKSSSISFFNSGKEIPNDAIKIGVWVYVEKPIFQMIRGLIIDSNGNASRVTFADTVDWHGFKYLEAEIPSDIPRPLKLTKLYIVQNDNKFKNYGDIYFDDLQFIK